MIRCFRDRRRSLKGETAERIWSLNSISLGDVMKNHITVIFIDKMGRYRFVFKYSPTSCYVGFFMQYSYL